MTVLQAVLSPSPLPDLAYAVRELIGASQAMDAHRHVNGYPQFDPVGDDLQADLDEARGLFNSACWHHGIDVGAFAKAIW
jgi:hypothetical protein